MRLLKDEGHGNFSLVGFNDDKIPHYAILSHTWGADGEEVTYNDLKAGTGRNKTGYKKIEFCRKQAASDGIQHFWVDTCCIDKSSSAELTRAINSMFRWYQNADKCYAYLSDVFTSSSANTAQPLSTSWEAAFRRSRWFSRGWTLQELIAPTCVEFFSGEGNPLGSKISLEAVIHEVTGIAVEALRGKPLADFGVAERLIWAEHRETKRQEDKAYSLLGLFDIYMPLFYGEGGDKAIERLRRKIDKPLNSPLEQTQAPPSPSSTVPFRRDADFVDRRTSPDRRTLLEQIERQCAAPAARVSLVGIGGVGKSQLAIEYCYRLRERSPDTWVFWIHASNTDRIKQGHREITERAKISSPKDPKENIFEVVARWLRDEMKGRWLLVLDNLDDDAVLSAPHAATLRPQGIDREGQLRRPLSAYLPQSLNGTILITTSTRSVATKLVEPQDIILVDPMTDTDAIELLQKKLDRVREKHDVKELAGILEYMPLAIVQAAAYIQQKGARYSVRQYIEAFQRNEKKKTSLLKYEARQLQRDLDARNSIIITWQISFDDLREKWPASADLLSLMSYFDPQGIPEEVLKYQLQEEEIWDITKLKQDGGGDDEKDQCRDIKDDGASETIDDDMFKEAVARLQSYSFILVREDKRTFEMHALVQLAIRKWLEMHGEEERWKAQFYRKLNAVLPTGDYGNWGLCEVLFPHAKSAERQQPTDRRSVREWAQILRKAAWYAWARGDYGEAARMCERSVEALRKVTGAEDEEMSYSLGLLATTYRSQARWTEAEKMEVKVIKIRRGVLGHEHPDTLTSMANLASTFQNQGRWTEAEKIEVEVIETRRRVLGDEHPDTLSSIYKLASTYQKQGRWTEAEDMFIYVMNIGWRVLGREHPFTLTSMANLASIYRNQGRWKDAEELEVQNVEAFKKAVGPEHPSTIGSMANLASTYRDQGRWEEAKELQVQVMKTSLKVLGPNNPDTLSSMANLASTLWSQGRWTEAEKIEVEVMQTSRRVLGEEHPDTLTGMANLALTFQNQGRWTEAEKIEVEVVETRRRVLGDEHPDTLTSIANLAVIYRNQGQWIEAEMMQVQVMDIRRRVLGEEHPLTLSSMNNLALTYWNQGRWTEAEKMFIQVVETRRMVLGKEHPDTLSSMNNLATTYRNQGRWTEAEKMQVQVMETSQRVLGIEHPSTLSSMNNLATTYRNQGRWTEAERMQVQVMETSQRVLGIEHPDTLSSMNNLATTYQNQGRWTEAERMQVQVIETSQRVLGIEHPSTLSSMNNLATIYRNQGRWTEAERMQVQVMKTSQRVLGIEHPDTLNSMNNLAFTVKEQDRKGEAIKLMAECVRLRNQVLGAEHPDALSSAAALAEWQSVE